MEQLKDFNVLVIQMENMDKVKSIFNLANLSFSTAFYDAYAKVGDIFEYRADDIYKKLGTGFGELYFWGKCVGHKVVNGREIPVYEDLFAAIKDIDNLLKVRMPIGLYEFLLTLGRIEDYQTLYEKIYWKNYMTYKELEKEWRDEAMEVL